MTHQPDPQTATHAQPASLVFHQKAIRRQAPAAPRPIEVVPYQPPLSTTEQRVLRLLIRGMTERQAAEALERSPNTVHVHVRNIYRKLGVSSRKTLFRLINTRPELIDAEDTGPHNQSHAAAMIDQTPAMRVGASQTFLPLGRPTK